MFKFIHAADIHLDSPLLNLDQYEGAPSQSLRVATREAFDNVIRLAIDEQVDFLLIAGDLYDKDSPDFNTPRHVRKKFRELESKGIRVFIIQGNHDAESTTKKSFTALTFPDNVHVFSTKKPETKLIDELAVAIHGQGFASRAVEDDLSSKYPEAMPGHFNVGMLHTNLGGNETHDNYAPSTTEGLRLKEYQYWALGHIHKRPNAIGGPKMQIRYSGSTQGRHIREAGEKGCLLVSVNDDYVISVKFHPTDVWRWFLCELDATGNESPEAILESVRQAIEQELKKADDRSLAVRVVIKGKTAAHRRLFSCLEHYQAELQRMTFDAFDDRVWIEKLRVRTSHPITLQTSQGDSVHGELIAAIQDIVPDADAILHVRDGLEKVIAKIPPDPRLERFRLDLDDCQAVKWLVAESKELLIAKLLDPTTPQDVGVE